jgi:cardiolipin synthase (CMP-forming)
VLNIPNTITLLRIVAVPFFLSLLVDGSYRGALVVFVAAGISDGIDGAIARLTNARTELGAHLDPLADKLLLVSAFVALGTLNLIPMQLMIIVIMRDVVILGGYVTNAVITGRPMEMKPSVWGKGTTFLQILTVVIVLVLKADVIAIEPVVPPVIFALTAAGCFVSGAGYVIDGIRWYNAVTGQDTKQAS